MSVCYWMENLHRLSYQVFWHRKTQAIRRIYFPLNTSEMAITPFAIFKEFQSFSKLLNETTMHCAINAFITTK